MYFVDDQHKSNFDEVCERWPFSRNNSEYCAACYILAVPMIFEKVGHLSNQFETPAEWYFDWRDADDDNKPYDLTSSVRQLGQLAAHLWNSDRELHLLDCLSSLDDKNYQVAMCAINVRMAREVG